MSVNLSEKPVSQSVSQSAYDRELCGRVGVFEVGRDVWG